MNDAAVFFLIIIPASLLFIFIMTRKLADADQAKSENDTAITE